MKLIVANWKMYLTLRQSVALAKSILHTTSYLLHTQIVLCPSFVAMEEVAKIVHGVHHIKLGAQDVEPEFRGAYTGEVGLDDLRELGVEYVLVGHSERRRYFKETDAIINKKVRAAVKAGMRPVLCVGEPSRSPATRTTSNPSSERRGNKAAQSYVAKQLRTGLRGVQRKDLKRVVIAYEPVWAIGTGRADSPEDASAMHEWIRKVIVVIYGGLASDPTEARPPRISVLYGGSVDFKNAAAFARVSGVDGLLIGKASTKFSEFSKIIRRTIS